MNPSVRRLSRRGAGAAAETLREVLATWSREGGGAGAEVPLPRGRACAVAAPRGEARPAWARCGAELEHGLAGSPSPAESEREVTGGSFPVGPDRLLLVDAEDGCDITRALGGSPFSGRDLVLSGALRAEAQALIATLRPRFAADLALPEGVRLLANVAFEDTNGTVDVAWVFVDVWVGETMAGEIRPGERIEWPVDAVLGLHVLRGGLPLTPAEIARLR